MAGVAGLWPAQAAPPNVEHTVLAWSGDPLAGGGFRGTVDPPVINDSGAVAFQAGSGNYAIWQGSARDSLRIVAQEGGAAPGGAGEVFDSFNDVIQDNTGRVMFEGTLLTGTGGVTSSTNEGWWAESAAGTLREVAREGKPVPGVAGAHYAAPFPDSGGRFSNSGIAAVNGSLSSAIDEVIVAGPPASMALLARSRQQGPGLGLGLGYRTFDLLASSSQGGVTFFADYWQNSNQQFKGYGGWSTRAGSLQNVFLDNVPTGAPPGYNIQAPAASDTGVNGLGHLAFRQLLTNPNLPDDLGMALFSDARGTLQYETGYPQPAPGLSGIDFASAVTGGTLSRPLLNNEGRIAFLSYLEGAGITTQNNTALWFGVGTHFALLARTGEQAPGVETGAGFAALAAGQDANNAPSLSSTGHLIFTGFVTGTGIDSTNNAGIWMTDRAGQLRLLARKGDTVQVAAGQTRTFSEFSLVTASGGDDGRGRCVGADGRAAFKVRFSTGDSAVIVARFTNDVPQAPSVPTLSIAKGPGANQVTLTWTTIRQDCELYASQNLKGWALLSPTPVVNGYTRTVTFNRGVPNRFFRLVCP